MRVLHLVKTAVGATWALRQMSVLVDLGVDVHVALPEGPLVSRYREAGVTVHGLQTDFPVRAPWRFPTLARQLRELVASLEPDVLHSHFVGTTLAMRLALGKTYPRPRLFQVPGPLHLENKGLRRAEIATAGVTDHWMASCEWTRRCYVEAGVPADRVFLSYYGVDLSAFRPAPPGRLRRELGLGESTKVVGMVAYLYAPKRYLGQKTGLKGHEDLIEALAIVRERRRDVVGVFVGGAWAGAEAYETRVRRYGRHRLGDAAFFLGNRSDVPALYADFDVVVHPSHSENVGGAAESLALEVPTIATRVGGFPDVVVPEETGWLVPPKSPEDIARAVLQALEDPARSKAMAARGASRVRSLFDIRRTAREVQETYERLTA